MAKAKEETKAVDSDQKLKDQNAIADALRLLKSHAQRVQNLSNEADELTEQLPTFDTIADLEGQLAAARTNFKQEKLNSKELQDKLDEVTSARVDYKIASKQLGALLVRWTARYQQRNVLLGTEMHEIILTAKLGKEIEDLQQPLPLFEEAA